MKNTKNHSLSASGQRKTLALSLGALGVVYGDIGTSPLYALRESLKGIATSHENVLGVLSLIFWSLVLVISVRYMILFMLADNEGEGGVLALLTLLKKRPAKSYRAIFLLAIFGAGLLLGDGMLTPAISVISAIEGLEVVSPEFSEAVVPLSMGILLLLFFGQRYGSARIGRFFGPVVLFWFATIGLFGAIKISQNWSVLEAANPLFALEFFRNNGWTGYALLGGVFLVMTGAEALYADLGHFGKKPIRIGWYFVVLPGLLLNYFGQGALLLENPGAIANPFYSLAPVGFGYPLIILATVVTVIASQAVISASFSLVNQATLLNLFPRMSIVQTSEEKRGQIYVPEVNFILACSTLLIILLFKSSSAIAGAYGLAVNLLMLIMGILVVNVAFEKWRWKVWKIAAAFFGFMVLDLAFLGANLHKFLEGGWIPIAFAAIGATIMVTWDKGMDYLHEKIYMGGAEAKNEIEKIDEKKLIQVPKSTAVFIVDPYDKKCGSLLRYLELSGAMPEHVLIVDIEVEKRPYVSEEKRYQLSSLSKNIHRLQLHLGFMESIGIPNALSIAKRMGIFPFALEAGEAVYYVAAPTIVATKKPTLGFHWQEVLFAFLMRNSVIETEYYRLPHDRTIAIGLYIEI